MAKITLNFDGSCEPYNPGGDMGAGIVVKLDGKVIHTDHQFTPRASGNSNNVAEYSALVNGLQWLFDNGYTKHQIEVLGDSMLVIRQMSGEWRAKGGMYLPKYRSAIQLATQFSNIRYRWIPRAQNAEADALSRSPVQA